MVITFQGGREAIVCQVVLCESYTFLKCGQAKQKSMIKAYFRILIILVKKRPTEKLTELWSFFVK